MLTGSLGVYTGGRVLLSTPASGLLFSHYRKVVAVLTAFQVLIIIVVCLPLWHILTGVHDPSTLAIFAVYCVLMVAASLSREGVHGVGKHALATMTDVSAATLQILLGILLHIAGQVTVESLLGCSVLGFVLQLALCHFSARSGTRRRRVAGSPGVLILTYRIVLFSLPGLVLAVGQLFIQKGDRLILGVFSPPREVGIYAAAATIADGAWILPVSLSVIVVRQVAVSGSITPLRKWRRAILLMTGLSSLSLALGGSTLIDVLLGSSYRSAAPILWILCASSPLFASQQVDLAACNGAGRLDVGARVTAWGFLTLILLSVGLIPVYQGVGAALASMGAYGCMAILARRSVRRIERERTNRDWTGYHDPADLAIGGRQALNRTNLGL